MLYKMKELRNILITILLLGSSFLLADECVDDATGAYTNMNMSCAMLMGPGFNMTCDQAFVYIPLSTECPVSCGTCAADCETEGVTSHGCCLPTNNMYINEGGSVLYNSTSVCTYCDELSYNNASIDEDGAHTSPWKDQKELCEDAGSTWNFDLEMSEEECAAVPDIGVELGGYWFDGSIPGYKNLEYGTFR